MRYFTLGCFFFLAVGLLSVQAQCDATKLVDEYVAKLTDYNYLKSYKFIDPKPSNEFSYVFTKGNSYKISICVDDEKKKSNIEITIYDRARNLVASNTSNRGKKKYILEYKCDTSGIFYIRYEFKDEPKFCGASVLAFKR